MPPDDDATSRSARQISRSQMRRTGDRSARIANVIMKLSETQLKRLDVEDVMRDAISRARRVKAHIARRRAERSLAGDLRKFVADLVEFEDALDKVQDNNADAQQFHLAEQWRARYLADGIGAAATFPGGADEALPRLIDAAKRERDIGKPPGAGRALFRHIVEALKTHQRAQALAAAESDDAAPDDTDDDDE